MLSISARRTRILLYSRRAISSAQLPPLPEVVTTTAEFRSVRAQIQDSIGFVPTMGSLHAGHISLVKRARAENKQVVVSIFVNPTQFAAHEDLAKYPRTLNEDLELLRGLADIVLAPSDSIELYPPGSNTVVDLGDAFGSSGGGESRARPHFFKGVATICAKLFNIVQPDKVYFGAKDAQQVAAIRTLIRDLCMPIELVEVPTSRASDGVALSSRNAYLSPAERSAAPVLFAALSQGAEVYRRAALALARNDRQSEASNMATSAVGEVPIATGAEIMSRPPQDQRAFLSQQRGVPRSVVEAAVRTVLAEEPLITTVEYVSIASRDGMIEVGSGDDNFADGYIDPGHGAVLSLAVVTAAGARLIDNVTLLPWGATSEGSSSSSSSSSFSFDNGRDNCMLSSGSPKSVVATAAKPANSSRKPLTALDMNRLHQNGAKLRMVTAYSAPMAAAVDASGAEMVLVGDSLGMVELGMTTTQPVTLDQMVHHCAAARRGVSRALLIADLPFGSYELSPEQALASAHRLVKEAGAGAVKLEGGSPACCAAVAKLVECGIPVVGHVGLTPQHAAATGGFRAQGRTAEAALKVVRAAQALEAAGCFAVVVECVPPEVGEAVTSALTVPTIGIGAGGATSGQVLVFHDMLGLRDHPSLSTADHNSSNIGSNSSMSSTAYGAAPKFCKKFADAGAAVHAGLSQYCEEVANGSFPDAQHSPYRMAKGQSEAFEELLITEGLKETTTAAAVPGAKAAASTNLNAPSGEKAPSIPPAQPPSLEAKLPLVD